MGGRAAATESLVLHDTVRSVPSLVKPIIIPLGCGGSVIRIRTGGNNVFRLQIQDSVYSIIHYSM